jgi:hypothetical protein
MGNSNETKEDYTAHKYPGLVFKIVVLFSGLTLFAQPQSLLAAADPNESCMACHEDQNLKDSNGRILFVNNRDFKQSIHGRLGITCVNCHRDLENITDFPHAERLSKVNCTPCHQEAQKEFQVGVHTPARSEKQGEDVSCVSCHGYHDILEKTDLNSKAHPLNQPRTCGSCHFTRASGKRAGESVSDFLQSAHAMALSKAGLSSSATCVTCHGAHGIKRTQDPEALVSRRHVPTTCGHCHAGILRDYHEGVHGQAFAKGIRDVPVCTDCHGEHNIRSAQDRQSKVYATQVALTCAKCHDEEELIRKYNLPKARLRTFQGSFHGIASTYGDARVANCASCHGFHNIRRSSDPDSPVHPRNLPQTCGHCHSGAGEKLAQVKIHVLDPKATNYAGYVVGKFYFYLIALLVGGFILYILADLKARLRRPEPRP